MQKRNPFSIRPYNDQAHLRCPLKASILAILWAWLHRVSKVDFDKEAAKTSKSGLDGYVEVLYI